MTKAVILQTEQTVSVETPAVLLDVHAGEVETLIAEFNEAKVLIKQLEEQKANAEARLRELLGSAELGLIAGVERLKISSRTRTDLDRETLKVAFPEAFDACSKSKTYTVLTAVS
jgi:hypothetical protein